VTQREAIPETPALLRHQTRGRNLRTAFVLVAVWAGLAAMLIALDAALWIVAGLALFTLPALWDLVSDRASGLALDLQALHWHSGKQNHVVPLTGIRTVRLDRRLDLSFRVSLILHDGRRIRLPHDCLPQIERLDKALQQAGLRVERHPFSLL